MRRHDELLAPRGAEEVFDEVVAKSPAFGRGGQGKKRGEWRIERDLPEMCALLAQLLRPRPRCAAQLPRRTLARAAPASPAPCLPLPQPGEGGAAPGAARLATGSRTLEAHALGGKDLAMGCFVRWSPPRYVLGRDRAREGSKPRMSKKKYALVPLVFTPSFTASFPRLRARDPARDARDGKPGVPPLAAPSSALSHRRCRLRHCKAPIRISLASPPRCRRTIPACAADKQQLLLPRLKAGAPGALRR